MLASWSNIHTTPRVRGRYEKLSVKGFCLKHRQGNIALQNWSIHETWLDETSQNMVSKSEMEVGKGSILTLEVSGMFRLPKAERARKLRWCRIHLFFTNSYHLHYAYYYTIRIRTIYYCRFLRSWIFGGPQKKILTGPFFDDFALSWRCNWRCTL